MSKRVYVSADYDSANGDTEVVEVLKNWGADNVHKVDFIDMAEVVSGSVSSDSNCRPCDLKAEFNRQINASSAVIFVVGDQTANRSAGSSCSRAAKQWYECNCTPYKQNANGSKQCKNPITYPAPIDGDVGYINSMSYLQHEFEQAKRKGKKIIIVYNSKYKKTSWLPSYMADFEDKAQPFWIDSPSGNTVGDYSFIKKELGYE